MPTCKRCGQSHYNFVSCGEHAAKVALEEQRNRAPRMVLRTREGARDFGNRLHTSQVGASNVVFLPRKDHPARVERERWTPVGNVVYPHRFFGGDEAA